LDRRDLTEAEVAACLRISSNMAATRLATARALTTRLPSTLSGLQHGRLDAYRAQIIAEHVTPLADAIHDRMIGQGRSPAEAERAAIAVATTIEDRVLGRPGDLAGTSPGAGGPRPDQTPTQLRASVKRAVIAADRAFAEDSRQQALKTRKVTLRTDLPDAMAALNIDLPAPEALAVWNVLDSCARELRSNGDPRTLDQLRTDTLVYLVLIGIIPTSPEASGPIPPIPPCETTGTAPGHPAFESEPQAKIPSTPAAKSPDASTEPVRPTDPECPTSPDDRGDRSDRTDQGDPDPGDPDPGDRSGPGRRSGRSGARVQVTVALDTLTGTANEPAELTGYGPITADLARAIAQHPDSTWRRLVTDPLSGQLLDYGRTTYRPPAALAEYVAARDVTCIHPNCSTPAEKSDLDHLIPYPRGTTSQENLRPLCRRHHRLKHEGGWRHRPSLAPTAAPGTIDTTSPTGHRYRRFQPAIGPSRRQETLATSTKPNHTQDLRPPPF
jgi:hypothetical protein